MKIGKIEKCFGCKELLELSELYYFDRDDAEDYKIFRCKNKNCKEEGQDINKIFGFYVEKNSIKNEISSMNFRTGTSYESIGFNILENWINFYNGYDDTEYIQIKLSSFSKFKEMNDDNFLEVREFLIEKFNQLRLLK